MITAEQKYRAQVFQIIGIAFLTPIAKVLLEPIKTFHVLGLVGFIYYLAISLTALISGLILLDLGRGILNFKERSRYGDK